MEERLAQLSNSHYPHMFTPLLHHHMNYSLKPFSFTPTLNPFCTRRKSMIIIHKNTNWASSTFNNNELLKSSSLITPSASHGLANSYVKPELLLPTAEVIGPAQALLQANKRREELDFLYEVRLLTSTKKASSLSDLNGGILIGLIGENGAAIIERISAADSKANQDGAHNFYSHLCFQTGSVDTFNFYGPNLGQLAALWIAPESGTWRLDEAIVTVIPCTQQAQETESVLEGLSSSASSELCDSTLQSPMPEEHAPLIGKASMQYVFKGCAELLGDKTDHPAMELTPSQISKILFGENNLEVSRGEGTTLEEITQRREIGLQEYVNLKLGLTISTLCLVVIGTACFAAIGTEELAKGFSVGGIGGIIHLLLLQKAVDGLPSAASIPNASENVIIKSAQSWAQSFLRSPFVRLVLVSSSAIAFRRLLHGDLVLMVQPQEILAGVAGYLASKVSILLVAFRSSHDDDILSTSKQDYYGD